MTKTTIHDKIQISTTVMHPHLQHWRCRVIKYALNLDQSIFAILKKTNIIPQQKSKQTLCQDWISKQTIPHYDASKKSRMKNHKENSNETLKKM
jgi:hypothetical protein